ncbi:MAG: tetratricopeptide repeat protein [Candidatus Melainabacteria bacterium]|nr:MAG: tetratricopeptide repeat protein [Candidatus Melainabacteria bacterium]
MKRFFLSTLLSMCVISITQAPAHSEWYASEHSTLEKAKRAYQSGRFDEARMMFTDLINANSRSAETYYWRGVTYNSLGQPDKALADFNQTIALDSNNPKYYLGRGLLYSNKNQYDEAIADFDSALRLDPDNDMASTNKKFCVQAIADKKKAEEAKIAKAKADAEKLAAEKLAAEQLALNPPVPVKKPKVHTAPVKPTVIATTVVSTAPTATTVAEGGLTAAQMRLLEKKQAELAAREAAIEAKLEKERQEREKLAAAKLEQQRLLKESKKNSSVAKTKKDSADEQVAEEPAAPPANRPIRDKWALIVGISKFKDSTLNLRYPSKDAKDFYDFLVTSAGFKRDHIKLLVDEEATRAHILSELGDKWLPRVANPDDLVVIYISSHGSASDLDVGGVNYLLAHDTEVDNLYASGLPMQDLTRIIKGRVHSDRIVLVLDACHSGATTVSDSKGLSRRSNVNADDIAQGTGQLVISSSMPNQVSWESKRDQNSVFTKYLMEGLKAKSNLGEAFDYMKNKVQEEVLRERGVLQTPVLKSKWQGAELVIGAPAVNPSPGLETEPQGMKPGQAAH